jgi:hypothetical protein
MNLYWLGCQAFKREVNSFQTPLSFLLSSVLFLKVEWNITNRIVYWWTSEFSYGEWDINGKASRRLRSSFGLITIHWTFSKLRIINAGYSQSSPIENECEMIKIYWLLISQFQIHHRTRRSRNTNDHCKFGYPHAVHDETWIENFQYIFRRSVRDQDIVPLNLELLVFLHCHHYLGIIHSDQRIGYILK